MNQFNRNILIGVKKDGINRIFLYVRTFIGKIPHFQAPVFYISLFAIATALSSCAPENNGLVGRFWHNTNSHYNSYFLAKERLKEMENQIFKDRKDNYNKILDIVLPNDSVKGQALKAPTEYIVQKASIGIQRHKYSKWTDDNYLLVGKARLYQYDLGNAIETFKYVNAQSPDESARHKAMIGLLRAFIWQKEYEKARYAIGYIRKEKLDKENTKDFYLTRAQLYKELDDYSKTAAAIKLALPLMKRGERKARTYFIAGQLYETLEKNKDAYKNYKAAIKNNPSFELDFNIRLNLIEVYQVKNEKESKKLMSLFTKMLNDEKNKEYKDQVYYQMGLYEYKQKHYQKSVEYLQKSAAISTSNTTQKSFSHLKLGEIYYDNLQEYELASTYYDSTMQNLPKDFKNYDKVSKRQKVLRNFVQQIVTIKTEDSLQKLAALDPKALDLFLDSVIDKEEDKRQKQIQKQKEKEEMLNSTSPFANAGTNTNSQSSSNSNKFYFYNTLAVSEGSNQFKNRWGNRPLEDNWRRSLKGLSSNSFANNPDNQTQPDPKTVTIGKQNQEQKEKADADARRKKSKEKMLATIPFKDEEKKASNSRIEIAYYKLGKIYNLDLQEPENALKTFTTMMERFPESEYGAEVLYMMFVIYKKDGKKDGMEVVKEKLLIKYPETDFARLANNPDYTQQGNLNDQQAEQVYANAYELYEAAQYDQSSHVVEDALKQYAESRLIEKFRLLQIFIVAKTQELPNYRFALTKFMTDFPKSKSLNQVRGLLDASKKYEEKPTEKEPARLERKPGGK